MRAFCTVSFVGLCLSVMPALADKSDYCAAYARDFADAKSKTTSIWQHKYDIALTACLAEPQKIEVIKSATVKKPQVKVAAPQNIPPEPVVVKTAPPKIAKTAETGKSAQLQTNTPAWVEYCTKKYTSFNVKTGTYTSRTGVERKCLVN